MQNLWQCVLLLYEIIKDIHLFLIKVARVLLLAEGEGDSTKTSSTDDDVQCLLDHGVLEGDHVDQVELAVRQSDQTPVEGGNDDEDVDGPVGDHPCLLLCFLVGHD